MVSTRKPGSGGVFTRAKVDAKNAKRGTSTSNATSPAAGAVETSIAIQDRDERDAADTKRARAVIGDVDKRSSTKGDNAGSAVAKRGFSLFGIKSDVVMRVAARSAIAGMVAAGMLALSATFNPARPDTVFFDHNDAPMEIQIAKKLAAIKGEKFVLVRPDAASLDALFSQAERGEIDIRHLILSGHSTGKSVWGTGADGTRRSTSMDDLKQLKAKYPKAFAQVEHVHFMACYAGSAGNSAEWTTVFPNATAIVGFWGSGPSKTQPAAQKMLQSSELHLRTLDNKKLTPQQALVEAKRMANMPGSNVTKFAIRLEGAHYALGEVVQPYAQLQDRVTVLEAQAFRPWMNPVGQDAQFATTPTNHQASPLRDYYNALQALGNVLEPGSSDVTSITDKIETTIRLIYFDVMVRKMEAHHGAELATARNDLAQLGFTLPDITKLKRVEIVELANQLDSLKSPQLLGFMTRNAADLALVGDVGKVDETDYPYAISQMSGKLAEIVKDDAKPADVKAAAQRLIDELAKPAPASFERAKELLGKGLRDLKPDVIPTTWID